MNTLLVSLLLAVPMPANYPSKPDYSADPSYVGECNFGPVFINGDRVRIGDTIRGRIENGVVMLLWRGESGAGWPDRLAIGVFDLDDNTFSGEWIMLDSDQMHGGWLETICIRPNP